MNPPGSGFCHAAAVQPAPNISKLRANTCRIFMSLSLRKSDRHGARREYDAGGDLLPILDKEKNSIMRRCSSTVRVLPVLLSLCLSSTFAFAQATQEKPFEPTVGQQGKDVVWVPTPQALVNKMLEMAKVTPSDFLMDLGSGDGRTVITAAKRGVKAMGIEYNPDMVALSIKNAAAAGVSDKATFVKADIFETDFSKATVITLFLLPDLNLRLRP